MAARRYEDLQARWRQDVLGLPAGPPTNPASRLPTVRWCLPHAVHGVAAADGEWNFVSDAAHSYDRHRAAGPALVFQDRLWRNMLSSQPLAFNIVGHLRAHPAAAASVLAGLTGLAVVGFGVLGVNESDTSALDGLDAEWAPPREVHTGDRSGFDIAALLCLDDGRRIILSVEVKYTDSFSPAFQNDELDCKVIQHRPHLSELEIGEQRGRELLGARTTSQFLRSVMITDSLVRRGLHGRDRLDGGIAVVLAPAQDQTARLAVGTVGAALGTTRLRTAFWSLEELLDQADEDAILSPWAERMRRRYLIGPG